MLLLLTAQPGHKQFHALGMEALQNFHMHGRPSHSCAHLQVDDRQIGGDDATAHRLAAALTWQGQQERIMVERGGDWKREACESRGHGVM